MLLMVIVNVCIEYSMMSKYYNHKDINYNIYSVKGITVCDIWLYFEFFEIDVQLLPGYD